MHKFESVNDIKVGDKAGHLEVLSTHKHKTPGRNNHVKMNCLCTACGKKVRVDVTKIKRGSEYASCGCMDHVRIKKSQWTFDRSASAKDSNKGGRSEKATPDGLRVLGSGTGDDPKRETDEMNEVIRLARDLKGDLGMTMVEAIKYVKQEYYK